MSKLPKILSLLYIVISMAINAQTSCNSPITSAVDTVCNYQNYYIPVGQGVSWHQFTGTGEDIQINLIQGFTVPGCVTKLTLLDSCNGTVLAMDSIVTGDSVLTLIASNTIFGNSYKILVEKNNSTFDANYEICFFKLAESKEHTLLICRDGKIEAFGDNSSGQLGSSCASDLSDIHNDYYNYFRILGITDTVVKVDVASSISMALTNKGDVYVWGANTNGVFGSLTPSSSSCPIQVQVCNIVDIALAENFAVAINTRGEVLTWGSNSSGQLGNGTTGGINSTPTKVTGISSAYKVDAGAAFVVVLDTTGRVYSWGSNGGGALGQNITTPIISSPALVRDGSNNVLRGIKDISSGETHTIALDSMNRLWVWGNNSSGQLGLAGANQFAALHLSAVDAINKIDIAAGRDFSILITGNNTYMGSGYNVGGVITPVLTGNGYDCVGSINPNANAVKTSFFPQYTLPVPTGATKIIDIQTAGAFQHNTVIYDNGKAITWGRNFYSQLGRYAPKINSCADTAPFVQPRSYDAVTLSYNPHCPAIAFKRPDTIQYIISGFPNDTAICNGSGILIDPTIFPQGGVYNWGNGNNDTTLVVTITGDTTIYLSYTICDTTLTDSMHITLKTFSAFFEQDTIKVCYGTDSLLLPLIGAGGDAPYKYQWTPANAVSCDTCPTPYGYLNPTGVTTFFLTVTDSNGCSASDNINVLVKPQLTPPILLTGQIHSCTADSAYCFSPSGVNYTINAPTATFINQINSDCFVIKWNINPDGSSNNEQFTVILTDNAGCQDSSQINLIACCGGAVGGQAITFNDIKVSQAFIDYPSPAHPSRTGINQFSTGWNNAIPYTTTDHIDINGTFTVDQNLTFSEANVKLSPYSKIVVNSGVTLTISGSYLHACQDTMWDGIYVQQGGNIVVTNSYFEDAQNAIVSENGASYTLNTSTFNKNYIGVLVQPYTSSHTGTINGCKFSSKYIGSAFSTGTQLISPYLTQISHIGVDVRSVYDIHVGDASLSRNIFDSLENGIRTSYSGTKIENNDFSNINTSIPSGTIKTLRRAIWITNLASAGAQQSNNNTVFVWGANQSNKANNFNNCQFGVWCNESHHLEILENDFTQISTAGVYYTNLTNINYNKAAVYQNTFTDCFRGVAAITNPRAASHIYENNFSYTNTMTNGIGILVQENNTGAKFNQHKLIAHCNIIAEARTGIKITNLIKPLVERNNINIYTDPTGTVFSEGIYTLNCYGSDINQNTVYASNKNQNWTTAYRLDMGGNSRVACNKANYVGKGFAFSGPQPGAVWVGNDMFHNYYGLELFNGGIIYDQVTNTTSGKLPNDNRWIGQYSFPYANTSKLTSDTLTRLFTRPNGLFFPTVNNGTPPIKIITLPTKNNIKCKYNCNWNSGVGSGTAGDILLPNGIAKKIVQDSINFNPYQYEKALKWWNKKNLLTALLNDSVISPDTILQQFKDSMQQLGFGILDSINGILCSPVYDTAIISPAISANLQANAADRIDSNIRTINNICLVQQLAGRDLNTQEIQQLEQIAQLCPLTDGVAVYMARVVLDPLDTIRYTNVCENQVINASGNRISGEPTEEYYEQQQEAVFILYPNPNDGRVTINYKLNATQSASLMIIDMMGKVLYQQELSVTKTVEQLNLTHLSKGVYLYTIQVNGEPKQNGKLVIQK